MQVILGVNHQFLYPQAMVDPEIHTKSLRALAATEQVTALDCWTWPEADREKEERKILLDSGKWINYNIGDRPMDEPCFPASADAGRRQRAYDLMMREIDHALLSGAKKIIFGSGADVPQEREYAKERYGEFLLKIGRQVPADVVLALEPTDRDVDKHFLMGPARETADFIRSIRQAGLKNLGMLLDMGHVPIMHETMASAISGAGDTLVHIHLGNCIIRNPKNPLYGDKHPVWGAADSEYGEKEAAEFLRLLYEEGYFHNEKDCTVSFEMRRFEGLSAEDTLAEFNRIYQHAMAALGQ